MAWMIGIDEAGYGPNLGPLVMTAVAFRVPEDQLEADLWTLLKGAVQRHPPQDEGRIVVDDSKRLYSTVRGLGELETNVLAALCVDVVGKSWPLSSMVERLCPAKDCLAGERWYLGQCNVPNRADPARCTALAGQFSGVCAERGVDRVHVSALIVNAKQFNELTATTDSKGAVLAHCLMKHVAAVSGICRHEPLQFFVDKHGDRNADAAMLQDALPEGMVTVQHESMSRSQYRVMGGSREVRFRIQPRADSEHFCVALASMVSKYLRELLMLEFNDFWKRHVPAIEPTAGYPGDSGRFYKQIKPAMKRLGMSEAEVWRCR